MIIRSMPLISDDLIPPILISTRYLKSERGWTDTHPPST